MKKLDWLTLFGWPVLVTVILLLLLVSPLLLPGRRFPSPRPFAAVVDVKYVMGHERNPAVSEELAEIRALYTPDLFASSRANRFSALPAPTNRLAPADIVPYENKLLLSFLPSANETTTRWFALTGRKVDDAWPDSEFRVHSPALPGYRVKKYPKLSIELQGELKKLSIDPDIFREITLPAGWKPWSVQAEARVSSEGRVEHLFAESINCEPSVYQQIIRRLYQYRFTNVTRKCEGLIIISYPVYFTGPDNPAVIRQ